MDNLYYLMHKDDKVGVVTIDDTDGTITSFTPLNPELSPYLGKADLKKIKIWWTNRAVPGSRKMMESIIREAGCNSNYEYLAKNLGLSMTDSYWVCPSDMNLKWDDVNLFDITIENNFLPYHSESSYDPNASLGGQMEKYWDLSTQIPQLVKTASAFNGLQAINEVNAAAIHGLQNRFSFVEYALTKRVEDDSLQSICNAFTSKKIELIPAFEITDSIKQKNDISIYDHFANVCEDNGLDFSSVRDFIDYQTMIDFVISNVDRHFNNFGVLRNADTFKLVSVAPIFDSGNSMFFDIAAREPYSRVEILDRKFNINGTILNSDEKLLKTVKNKNVMDVMLLPNKADVKSLYLQHNIKEQKAEFIASNYDTKKVMLNEFIHGKTISLYNEKKNEGAKNSESSIDDDDCELLIVRHKGR